MILFKSDNIFLLYFVQVFNEVLQDNLGIAFRVLIDVCFYSYILFFKQYLNSLCNLSKNNLYSHLVESQLKVLT